MHTRIFTFFLFALAFAIPASAQSFNPSVSLSWEQCDPIVTNRDFAGRGVYTIVVVGTHFEGAIQGGQGELIYKTSTGIYDAWRFENGGCNAGRLSVSGAEVAPGCPALAGKNPVALVQGIYWPPYTGGWRPIPDASFVQFWFVYEPVEASPATQYTLAQLRFDHAWSTAGPTVPGESCGNADQPLCIALVSYQSLDGDNVAHDVESVGGNRYLTWNDATATGGCPLTPAKATTWGQLKAAYH